MPIFGGKPLPFSGKLPDPLLFPISPDESRRECPGFQIMQKGNTVEVDIHNADTENWGHLYGHQTPLWVWDHHPLGVLCVLSICYHLNCFHRPHLWKVCLQEGTLAWEADLQQNEDLGLPWWRSG